MSLLDDADLPVVEPEPEPRRRLGSLPAPLEVVRCEDAPHVVGWQGVPICGSDVDRVEEGRESRSGRVCPLCVSRLRERGVM